MLSSSPSPLLSTLSALTVAGGDAAPAGAGAAPGFAELLNGLATKADGAAQAEEGTEAAVAGGPSAAKGKTLSARAERLAIAVKVDATDGEEVLAPAVLPATATEAAIESGKILPVALPEAAEGEANPIVDADAETVVTANPFLLPVLPGALPAQSGSTEPTPPTAIAPRRRATIVSPALGSKVNPAAGQRTDKAKPEAQAGGPRPAKAVAITVAAPVQAAVADAAEAGVKPVMPARPKTVRAADLARIEAPLPQMSSPAAAAVQFTQADQAAQTVNVAAPTLPAMPSPSDIDAALDHLVAAREALMPAEAALAIDHAEFGEVSIKFEQSSDGRLSAELSAADPELQRAVTAATAADRGPTTTPDGDGRSAQLASHRGSATASGDAAGGRGQSSGGQSNAERDMPQRRAPSHSQGGQTATDQRPGVFA